MKLETLLQATAQSLSPTRDQHRVVRERVMHAQKAEHWLLAVRRFLRIDSHKQSTVFSRVAESFRTQEIFDSLHDSLTPSAHVKAAIYSRLEQRITQKASNWLQINSYRWVAATMVATLIVGLSPKFMLAPQILADSDVRIEKTAGEVFYITNGAFAPLQTPVKLDAATTIRTENGEATISFKDDAVVRLAPFTEVRIHNLQSVDDRTLEPEPTFSLVRGQVWAQGLMPSSVRGMAFSVPAGIITVHEGSFSAEITPSVTLVSVWDRSVSILSGGKIERINSSSRIALYEDDMQIQDIDSEEYAMDWVKKNLSKDAVHRAYIAALQQERLRSIAGTLPTSTFYPVKRLAERVDVLLTFSDETRLKKQINQAETRLSEAVALLSDEQTKEQGEDTLREYTETVDSILAEDTDGLSELLVSQSLQDIQANTAALKPTDSIYAVKEVVLVKDSQLHGNSTSVEAVVLADTLDTVTEALDTGDTALLLQNWEVVQTVLEAPQVSNEQTDVYNQALRIAQVATDSPEIVSSLSDDQIQLLTTALPTEIATTLPVVSPAVQPDVAHMSIEQVQAYAERVFDRVYTSDITRNRISALRAQLRAIENSPDEGSILRALNRLIPSNSELSQLLSNRLSVLSEMNK
jgi:Domain of unknown function (DUF5667)/FecR protein